MARTVWNDERMDDAVATFQREMSLMREDMGQFRGEMREFREEMREFRLEMRSEMRALRVDFSALQRQLAQIGWGLAAALIVGMVALVAAAI